MRQDDIIQFLRVLGVHSIDLSSDGEWVTSSCPLASFSHIGGVDSRPSFGIKINDGGESSYNCFTCGTGSLFSLVHRLQWTTGISDEAHDIFLMCEAVHSESIRTVPSLDYPEPYVSFPCEEIVPEPVPGYVLEEFQLLMEADNFEGRRCREWLEGRGIDLSLADEYSLRISPEHNAIIFPIVDVDGLTYYLHARSRLAKDFFFLTPVMCGHPELSWGRRDWWFGIQSVDWLKPVILVESETDLLRLRSLGVGNILASCGSPGRAKLGRILSDLVYMGYDSDLSGVRYCRKTIKHLHSSADVLYRLSWATVGIGDAGELSGRDQFDRVWLERKYIEWRGGDFILKNVVGGEVRYEDRFA